MGTCIDQLFTALFYFDTSLNLMKVERGVPPYYTRMNTKRRDMRSEFTGTELETIKSLLVAECRFHWGGGGWSEFTNIIFFRLNHSVIMNEHNKVFGHHCHKSNRLARKLWITYKHME